MPTQDEIDRQLKWLHSYRAALVHDLNQVSQLSSAYTPPNISQRISEARAVIATCKVALRAWGVAVEDHPDDAGGLKPEAREDVAEVERALRAALPAEAQQEAPGLARLLRDMSAGEISAEAARKRLDADPALAQLLRNLVGQQISVGQSAVAFGEGSQVGDVSIRDVAGRDIITVNVYHGAPGASVLPAPKAPANGVGRPLRVFLCHSSADKIAVRRLSKLLADGGAEPWLDEEQLIAGQDWRREIPTAVEQSDVVLVCLSRDAASREGYLRDEISFALTVAERRPEGEIFLIPLLLEPCEVPGRLARWHWVSLAEPQGLGRLLRALRARAAELGAVAPVIPAGSWSEAGVLAQPALAPAPTDARATLATVPQRKTLRSRREFLIVTGVGAGALAALAVGQQIMVRGPWAAPSPAPDATQAAEGTPAALQATATAPLATATDAPETPIPATATIPAPTFESVPTTTAGALRPGDINWPPPPDFSYLTDRNGVREKALGAVVWVRNSGDSVTFTNDFEKEHIIEVSIPQLARLAARGVKDAPADGVVRFHNVAADQLVRLWAAWESVGLLDRILTCAIDYVPRTVRENPRVLSNHAYGTAFDLNSEWNGLLKVAALVGEEGSVRELVPLANAFGFYWGGHWNFDAQGASDGMHFEWAVPR